MAKIVPPKKAVKKTYNKQELVFAAVLIIAAFVCIFAIIYLVVTTQRQVEVEYDALQEKLVALNIERTAVAEQAAELRQKQGTTLSLKKLLVEAQELYGQDEKNRKEGTLWIDRAAGTCYVTLGAVQGLEPGDRLQVFDGDKEIVGVRVETPLDVISYVRPIAREVSDLEKDYYRVAIPR